MATLHLIHRSPADGRALEHCLARAGQGDAVLLMEDAVYAAVAGAGPDTLLRAAADSGVAVYALIPDLEARGLEPSSVTDVIRPVDYRGFVALTVTHNPIQSWS
jgi:tRNA 2-thiouridine synthesizing protein B